MKSGLGSAVLGRIQRLTDDPQLVHDVRALLQAGQLVHVPPQAPERRSVFNALGDGHRDDRGHAPPPAGHVGDPASDGGLVQDFGQLGPQFADADLSACVRGHTPMVAAVHVRTQVYTRDYGRAFAEPP